jgi:hypothetical protein
MIMSIDKKKAILQNNFQTESKSAAKTRESASSDAVQVAEPPVPALERPARRGGSEGPQSTVAAGFIPQIGSPTPAPGPDTVPAPSSPLSLSEGEGSRVREESNPKSKRGPKTKRGKRAVSRNAIKHGIMSPHPVIIEGLETVEGWEEFESKIVASWDPQDRYEREHAEFIAFQLWRRRRCRIHETAVLNHQVQRTAEDLYTADAYLAGRGADVPDPDPARVAAHQQLRIIPGDMSIDRIMRYEAHVHRLLVSTIHELEAHQARRRGEQTPLARVDFSSPPNLGPHRSAPSKISDFLAGAK